MKVYACYLRVQKVEHWEIISEDIQFITSSGFEARDWSRTGCIYSDVDKVYLTHYFEEFELQ